MSGPRLVVVGDAMLDVALEGSVERVCPDAPVPVVDQSTERARPGGAGLAALLAAADGHEVTLVTALGDDVAGARVRDLLVEAGVEVVAAPLGAPTPEKVRVVADDQVLVRVDRGVPTGAGHVGPIPPRAVEALGEASAVVVADYGRGTTGVAPLRHALAAVGGRAPVVWDPHPRGGAPTPGTCLATPNAREAMAATGEPGPPTLAALTTAGRHLVQRWDVLAVAITRGAQGAVLVQGSGSPLATAGPRAQGGPGGAGDRFAVAAAGALARGSILSDAVTAACQAAARYVAAGTTGVAAPAGGPGAPGGSGATERGAARLLADDVRARGGTVVVTGGCFDLLHAGHVSLLHQARALGDCLIVCINTDRSVRDLKGPGRPVVGEADRARVLAAIGAVDAVVLFDEPDPRAVLAELRPDVFVKGGDYATQDLVETETLAAWGGQVVLVPYLDGRSTTRLIAEASDHVPN